MATNDPLSDDAFPQDGGAAFTPPTSADDSAPRAEPTPGTPGDGELPDADRPMTEQSLPSPGAAETEAMPAWDPAETAEYPVLSERSRPSPEPGSPTGPDAPMGSAPDQAPRASAELNAWQSPSASPYASAPEPQAHSSAPVDWAASPYASAPGAQPEGPYGQAAPEAAQSPYAGQQQSPYAPQGGAYPAQASPYAAQGGPYPAQAGAYAAGATQPQNAAPYSSMPYMANPAGQKSSTGKTLAIVLVAVLLGLIAIGAVITMSLRALSHSLETETNRGSYSRSADEGSPRPGPDSDGAKTPSLADTEVLSVEKDAEVTDWSIHVSSFTPEGAAVLLDYSPTNNPSAAGMDQALVDLSLTYTGSKSEGGDYLFDLDLDLVDEAGTVYRWTDADGLAPDDIYAEADTSLDPGTSISGKILFSIPEGGRYSLRITNWEEQSSVDIPLN